MIKAPPRYSVRSILIDNNNWEIYKLIVKNSEELPGQSKYYIKRGNWIYLIFLFPFQRSEQY